MDVENLKGLNALAISPDGKFVYAASHNYGTTYYGAVTVFRRASDTGVLAFVETEVHRSGADDGLRYPTSVAVSPSGENLYIVDAVGDAIATCAQNSITGEIDFVEIESQGINGVGNMDNPYSATVSPDGSHVIVAVWGSSSMCSIRDRFREWPT